MAKECNICFDAFDPNKENHYQCDRYDLCTICYPCIESMISFQFNGENSYLELPKCCIKKIPFDVLIDAVGIKQFNQFEEKISFKYIMGLKNSIKCPGINCNNMIIIKKNCKRNKIKCDNINCNITWCRKCNKEWKKGHKKKCKKYDKEIKKLLKKKKYKMCHYCNILIKKNKGCSEMTCSNCNKTFCWKCNRSLNKCNC